MTPEKPKRALLVGHGLEPRPQFHEKTPLRREKKERNLRQGDEKKNAKCWAPHPPPPSGPRPSLFLGLGHHLPHLVIFLMFHFLNIFPFLFRFLFIFLFFFKKKKSLLFFILSLNLKC